MGTWTRSRWFRRIISVILKLFMVSLPWQALNKRHMWTYKLVSQSCAVAKSENFWRATGQSNLANRMEDCSTGQSAVVVSENENKEQKRLLGLGSYGVAWLTRRSVSYLFDSLKSQARCLNFM